MAWIDYRSLCAAIYRYPDDLMLAQDAWKSYIADGFMPLDPANEVDEAIKLLMPTPTPDTRLRVRRHLMAGVSEKVVRFFTERGFRNFGVEMNGLAATRLLLGRLASQEGAFGPPA